MKDTEQTVIHSYEYRIPSECSNGDTNVRKFDHRHLALEDALHGGDGEEE